MPNPNPHKARQAKKRRAKPGSIQDLTEVLWRAVSTLEEHLTRTADAEEVDIPELCKLSHALSQSAGVYLKALETGEHEGRLASLEAALEAQNALTQRRAA